MENGYKVENDVKMHLWTLDSPGQRWHQEPTSLPSSSQWHSGGRCVSDCRASLLPSAPPPPPQTHPYSVQQWTGRTPEETEGPPWNWTQAKAHSEKMHTSIFVSTGQIFRWWKLKHRSAGLHTLWLWKRDKTGSEMTGTLFLSHHLSLLHI